MVKRGMAQALAVPSGGTFTKADMRPNWEDYLAWARGKPNHHRAMHLLLESGLASETARFEADAMFTDIALWMADAHARGDMHGPSVEYVTKLIFFHLDLVIDQGLSGDDEALAFDMLCTSIGVTK